AANLVALAALGRNDGLLDVGRGDLLGDDVAAAEQHRQDHRRDVVAGQGAGAGRFQHDRVVLVAGGRVGVVVVQGVAVGRQGQFGRVAQVDVSVVDDGAGAFGKAAEVDL